MEVTRAISFLLERYYIVMKFSPRLILTRNGSLLMNIMYVDNSSSLCDSSISLGISTYSLTTLASLRLTDSPFNEVISGPKTSLAFFTSSKVTGQLMIMFEHTMFSKSRSDRNPSWCIAHRASQPPPYYLRVNPSCFYDTVLISRTLFSLFAT